MSSGSHGVSSKSSVKRGERESVSKGKSLMTSGHCVSASASSGCRFEKRVNVGGELGLKIATVCDMVMVLCGKAMA